MKQEECMTTSVFGSEEMLKSSPVDKIPQHPTTPEIAYRMVKDETFAQTQPRLNLATFVTTYMDPYATKLMNDAIAVNYIDETEYPRIAVMCAKCINIIARAGQMESRSIGNRFKRSLHAWWRGSLAALEETPSGRRQAC